jgi:hypothetical protein
MDVAAHRRTVQVLEDRHDGATAAGAVESTAPGGFTR